jgi:hypothetical protein
VDPEQFNRLLVNDVWPRFPAVRDDAAIALTAAFASQWDAIRGQLADALTEAVGDAPGGPVILNTDAIFTSALDERIRDRLQPVLAAAAISISASLLDELPDTARETAEEEILRALDRQMDRITWVGDEVAASIAGVLASLATEATLDDSLQAVRDAWGRFQEVASQRIAATETVGAFNGMVFVAAGALGAGLSIWLKVWNHVGDRRVRPAHRSAGQQAVPQGGVFIVGGEYLRYPGDPFGSAAMTANCRCFLTYESPPFTF